ncbi:MFS transporter [Streptomyces sp. NPDC059897]|uniref:MFS transporter n=1 Tax=Streptomyces sp. NPDC059897 TaxID=3346994 RepID=UPI0036649B05
MTTAAARTRTSAGTPTSTRTRTRPALDTEAAAPGRGGRTPALIAALLGFAVITIDVSAVNIALPGIRDDLHGGMTGLQWVADAYTLMFAGLMLSAGALSDRTGARRAYVIGTALFTVASLACALAPGLGALIAARVVQGGAAAVLMPASLALIREAYDDARQRARAVALWTVGGSVSMAAGPVLGGVLTEHVGWRAVFFLNLPVGAAILALLTKVAPSPRRPAPLDVPGQITAVLTLAGLTFAVIEGGGAGLAALAVAVVSAITFYVTEKRHRAPMVPLPMLRDRTVSVSLAVGFAINVGFYGVVFLLGLYLQQLRGMSATAAGLVFVPLAVLITGTNLISPRVAERFGRRPVVVIGQLVLALAMFALLPLTAHTPAWLLLLLLVPTGLGGAFAIPAVTAMLMDAVPGPRVGTASGLLNALRQTGGALAVALFGTLLAGQGEGTFSLAGMRISLVAAGTLLLATAVLSAATLPRKATNESPCGD